jgi:uncharacterized delta-60 repeat protein
VAQNVLFRMKFAMKHCFTYVTLVFSLLMEVGHGAPGDVDPSFSPVFNSTVSAICVQPDGRILVGGRFTNVNGVACDGLTRLNSDGTLDATFLFSHTRTNSVFSIALQPDQKIVIGGRFATINGTSRNGIARLNPDGTLDSTFDPGSGVGGLHSYVQSVALQPDGAILIVGPFLTVNGTNSNGFARLNPDGSLDNSFAPAAGGFESMAVQPDGKIIIGGTFGTVNGVTANNIARLDSAGNLDTSFVTDPGLGRDVAALALLPDGRILVGGGMVDSYYGIPFSIARLNSDGTIDSSFDAGGGVSGAIGAMALAPGGKPVIGGGFLSVDGASRVRIARLKPEGGVDSTFDPGTGLTAACKPFCPSVSAVAVQADGKILAGGSFTNANGVPRSYLARFFGSAPPQFTSVTALADGTISLTGFAATNARLRLEASSNLADWLPLAQLTNTDGVFHCGDPFAANFQTRFYRAAWLP